MQMSQYLERVIEPGLEDLTNYLNANGAANSSVDIEYTDIYINTPAACIILCNVVKQIVDRYNLRVNSFTVNTSQNFRGNFYGSSRLSADFDTRNDRDTFLQNCAQQIIGTNVHINATGLLQHDRSLIVREIANNFAFEIEPNGGFDHGWVLDDSTTHREADTTYDVDYDFFMFNKKSYVGIKFSYSWGI